MPEANFPDSGFRVLDSSVCQWTFDFGLQPLLGFRIPWAVLWIPKPRIPDYTSKKGIRIPLHKSICFLVFGTRDEALDLVFDVVLYNSDYKSTLIPKEESWTWLFSIRNANQFIHAKRKLVTSSPIVSLSLILVHGDNHVTKITLLSQWISMKAIPRKFYKNPFPRYPFILVQLCNFEPIIDLEFFSKGIAGHFARLRVGVVTNSGGVCFRVNFHTVFLTTL